MAYYYFTAETNDWRKLETVCMFWYKLEEIWELRIEYSEETCKDNAS
jgi:hypothetical protein